MSVINTMKQLLILFSMLSLLFSEGAYARKVKESNIVFGNTIDPKEQIKESRRLAKRLISEKGDKWRAKGDQHRSYYFDEAKRTLPYRICVPDSWDGKSKLPLVLFLHGGWNDENSYLDQNDKQLVKLANEHGYLLVSPLGGDASYGNELMLPGVFGKDEVIRKIITNITPERRKAQIISEKDIINVLEIVMTEYPVDKKNLFLMGHSMGSGGTWYLGAKYSGYWNALAPLSGPFVTKEGYPWENLRKKPIFYTEGTKAGASLSGSRELSRWLKENNFNFRYKEVDGDHGSMVPMVLPDIFDFLDSCRR